MKRRRCTDALVTTFRTVSRTNVPVVRGPAYESRLADIALTRTTDSIFNYRHFDEGSLTRLDQR